MISTNQNYILNLENKALTPKSKIIVDGVEYLGNVIKTFPKIKHQATALVGGFPSKTVTFSMTNTNNDLDFIGKEVHIYQGFVINGSVQYIKQGVFIPREDKVTNNITTKILSFNDIVDKTQLLEDKYESNLDWIGDIKHTGLEIVQEICFKFQITLKTTNFAFANYLFSQPNFAENITYRQVIARLAEIGGEIAIFDNDGDLVIKKQTETNSKFGRNRYEKISEGKEVIINTVVLGRKNQNNDIIYPQKITGNRTELRIEDNPFVDLNREEMIEEVAKNIIGLRYMPYELQGCIDGHIYEINDVVNVLDRNNNIVRAVILNIENTTRIKSKIQLSLDLKQTTDYNLAGSSKSDIAQVKLDVDHINQTIEMMAENISEYDEKISKAVQTSEKIEQSVSEIFDAKRSMKGKVLELESCAEGQLYSLKIIGNIIPTFPRSNLYPSENLFLKPKPKLIITHTENDKQLITTYDLPIIYLAKYNSEIYDEFIIDKDTNVKLIRRVGLDANGEKFPLEEESIIDLGQLEILLFEGNNKIVINYYNVNFEVEYVVKNNITDFYAVNSQVDSKLKQLRNEIELLVEQETDGEKLIASINITPGQIKLEGTVTANGNFQILQDGSIVAKNGSFSGNIYLENGGKVIGGDGLLSNLHFESFGVINGWGPIGFTLDDNGNVLYQDLVVDYNIPKNFKVTTAYLTLYTTKVMTSYFSGSDDKETEGFPKRLKLGSGSTNSIYSIFWGLGTSYFYRNDLYFNEIKNGLGIEEYTPEINYVGDVSEISSINLAGFLSNNEGNNQFIIRTFADKPSDFKTAENKKKLVENTGIGRAVLNIIGYMSFTEEESDENGN